MVCSAVGFLEGGVFVQHVAHHRNVIALVLKKTGDGAAQTLMRDIVGGMGGDRQIAACQLVLALGACLDHMQLAFNGKIDGLMIADLEMQEPVVLDAAPVAAKSRSEPMKLMAPAM